MKTSVGLAGCPKFLTVIFLTSYQCIAQGDFSIVHNFNGPEGCGPYDGLIQASDGNFYGATTAGGIGTNCWGGSCGNVFRMTRDGTVTSIHEFSNDDGMWPFATVVQGWDGALYGVCNRGGLADCRDGCGTIFRLTLDGDFTVLHKLNNDDGYGPSGPLIQGIDGAFYGTTSYGGNYDQYSFTGGTLFRITSDGTFAVLHRFGSEWERTDHGAEPTGPLVQTADGSIYGVTLYGGTNWWTSYAGYDPAPQFCNYGCGVVFRIAPNGTYSQLHEFAGGEGGHQDNGLILASDGNLYGTSKSHGQHGYGSVWKISPTGGELTVLHHVGDEHGCCIEGIYPDCYLVEGADGNLYGSTHTGGINNCIWPGDGTIFRITPSGRYTTLFQYPLTFTCDNGAAPYGGILIGSDGDFYITSSDGGYGDYYCGNIFRLSCVVTLDENSATFDPPGGTGEVFVSTSATNCSWTALSNDSFVTITGGVNGEFTGIISYMVNSNQSTASRSAQLQIGQETFNVFQAGIPCVLNVDPLNADFPAEGGAGNTSITSNGTNCQWTAKSDTSWIHITSGSTPCAGRVCPITTGLFCGCGNGGISFRVDRNQSAINRTGAVSVAGQTLAITQAAGTCAFELGSYSAVADAAGGSNTVTVIASDSTCEWTTESHDAFISVTSSDNGNVSYTVAPNIGHGTRTGTLTIAGQIFTVSQPGSGCGFTLKPRQLKCPASGTTKRVKVKTHWPECEWTAECNAPFITLTSALNGAGKGVVEFEIAANSGTTPRVGTLKIAGQTVVVNQAGAR